jgi:hypothetical protein
MEIHKCEHEEQVQHFHCTSFSADGFERLYAAKFVKLVVIEKELILSAKRM